MDDRRFDALTRSFGQGGSRRALLKGLLGLGGVTAAGTALVRKTDAARRGQSGPSIPTAFPTIEAPPTEPPAPTAIPSCPGIQTPCGADCCCPAGNTKCGPDCCPDGQAECCDNACCYGTCFGEELCCPSPRAWCEVSGECCPDGWRCCPDFGCIGPEQCCTSDDCTPPDCTRGTCTDNHLCDFRFDCTLSAGCCTAEACHRSDCNAETGSCGEPVFDCALEDGCCESGNVCAPERCDSESGTCEQSTAITCGCVDDGNGGTVSCGECGPTAPCCTNGVCGACPACACQNGTIRVNLADGSTRTFNGGGVCLSPCNSNADCPCGQLCVASYQLCLPGTPTVDCTSSQRPPGAYCAGIVLCSIPT